MSETMSLEQPNLLLLSNSKSHGGGFLDWCLDVIQYHFRNEEEVLYLPYAMDDMDAAAITARFKFKTAGMNLRSIRSAISPHDEIRKAKAVFVGSGNTFLLLQRMYAAGLINVLRERILSGECKYFGVSAGATIACPTIKTTNDMPVVLPPFFNSLNLVPFQINPHYPDSDSESDYMGETREQRILEFLQHNDTPVVGLRESSGLEVFLSGSDGVPRVLLHGKKSARIFRKNCDPEEAPPGILKI
jgi:dipeptidase E